MLTYLKSHNEFYEDVFITKCLSVEDMFRFSHINIKGKQHIGWKKIESKYNRH